MSIDTRSIADKAIALVKLSYDRGTDFRFEDFNCAGYGKNKRYRAIVSCLLNKERIFIKVVFDTDLQVTTLIKIKVD